MGIKLDLPAGFRHTTAHLMWSSKDGKTIDEVGLHVGIETGQPGQMFRVNGDLAKAEAVIAEKVVPLLKQIYGLGDKPEVKQAPVPEVPVEIVEAKKVAARLKKAREEILT